MGSDLSWRFDCNRLMGMCCWMGSHSHDWIDYNGVASIFSRVTCKNAAAHFQDFGAKKILARRDFGY